MKVEVIEIDKKETYPCLKISKGGRIVMFIAPRKGTIVRDVKKKSSEEWPVTPSDWTSDCWAEQYFEPFNGSITLYN